VRQYVWDRPHDWRQRVGSGGYRCMRCNRLASQADQMMKLPRCKSELVPISWVPEKGRAGKEIIELPW